MILKVFIIIIIILILFHYNKYNKTVNDYEIEQQELEYIDGNTLYDNLNPLVITFIENNTLKYNIETYKLYSSISINLKYFLINTTDNYLRHTGELLLIRSNKDINIELINPKYIKFFNKNNNNINLENYTLPNVNFKDVVSIDILLHEYNILMIPRFWLFKFSIIDTNVEIFKCENIFTKLFNIFTFN